MTQENVPRGYVIVYPDCIMDEVMPSIEILEGAVDLQTLELSHITEGLDADFLLIPGGSCDAAIVHDELHKLVNRVYRKKGLLAGICNGALVLASAGVLSGHDCTHTAHPKYAPLPEFKELLDVAEKLFKGTTYVDEDVVLSRNVLTAKPYANLEFAQSIRNYLLQ